MRFLDLLSGSSLAAYFSHEMFIYFQLRHVGLAPLFQDRQGWPVYLALTTLVVILTALSLQWVNRIYVRWDALFQPQRSPDGKTARG